MHRSTPFAYGRSASGTPPKPIPDPMPPIPDPQPDPSPFPGPKPTRIHLRVLTYPNVRCAPVLETSHFGRFAPVFDSDSP